MWCLGGRKGRARKGSLDAQLLQVVGRGFGEDGEDDAVGPHQQAGQGLAQEGVQPGAHQTGTGSSSQRTPKTQVEVYQWWPPATHHKLLPLTLQISLPIDCGLLCTSLCTKISAALAR